MPLIGSSIAQLQWQKVANGEWGTFSGVDLSHAHFDTMEGVYVVWQGGGRVIRVGQGFVRDRVADHRTNRDITAYNNLYVSWAPVARAYRDGVERYLANTLNPVIGDAFPNAIPIPVSLPWPWQSS